jgi:hypothetical protein
MEGQDDNITLVTAFLEIGRENWGGEFKRTASFYIDSFLTYLNYPYKMVCFIDDKYLGDVLVEYSKSPYKNKRFIPINRMWLDRNIHAWKKVDLDREILQNKDFHDFLKKRIPIMYPNGVPEKNARSHLCPENIYPEYNVINHSKIDFIVYAIENGFISTDFVAWSDFGYFNTYHSNGEPLPQSTIDIEKLNKEKITFCLRREIMDADKDIYFTLFYAYELFVGAFYAGPTNIMKAFQQSYHDSLEYMYSKMVSDDDQHVYIHCYVRTPELMDLKIFDGDWPRALNVFSK